MFKIVAVAALAVALTGCNAHIKRQKAELSSLQTTCLQGNTNACLVWQQKHAELNNDRRERAEAIRRFGRALSAMSRPRPVQPLPKTHWTCQRFGRQTRCW